MPYSPLRSRRGNLGLSAGRCSATVKHEMKLGAERVRALSGVIVDRLITGRFMASRLDATALAKRIERVMTEDLMVEDRLDDEVRGLLKTYAGQMARGSLDYHTMFLLAKKKLIKERDLIL